MSRHDEPAGKACPFCQLLEEGSRPLGHDGQLVVAFEDHYPSAQGHTLVIPRRHVGRLGELSAGEAGELWRVALEHLAALEEQWGPDAFTLGVNDGAAAGQTVDHVHLHVIPRHDGDVTDARGGVRWVLPETAAYWGEQGAET